MSLACDEWKPVAMAACSYLAALVSSSDSKDKRLQAEESVSAKIKVQKESLLATTSRYSTTYVIPSKLVRYDRSIQ